MENIYWKDIPKGGKVREVSFVDRLNPKGKSSCFMFGEKTIYWTGRDAVSAQTHLSRLVKKGGR